MRKIEGRQEPAAPDSLLVLSSALAYGQAMTVPVVSPGSVGPGEARPYPGWSFPLTIVQPSTSCAVLGRPCSTANPCYYYPSDIWTAYGLPPLQARGHDGQGITIGIVDAYYDPTDRVKPHKPSRQTFICRWAQAAPSRAPLLQRSRLSVKPGARQAVSPSTPAGQWKQISMFRTPMRWPRAPISC